MDEEFIACMEDVLDTYALPIDPHCPVVCFDESPIQLLAQARPAEPCAPGKPRREDFEYVRCGTANAMMVCQPAAGLRICPLRERKTKDDFAKICLMIEELFPLANTIKLVMDNLGSHTKGAFYRAFEPETARRLARKFEFHFTPKHGSWLNAAECELADLARSVFKKRIGDSELLQKEIDARCASRNRERRPIKWSFTTQKAREKMGSCYESVANNQSD